MRFKRELVWTVVAILLSFSSNSFSNILEQRMVRSVIDGDTIVFSTGEHARLIGIDTPEREQPFYNEAAELLRSFLIEPNVSVDYDKDRKDTYGRLLIYLYLPDGTNINDMMLENGMARVYFFPPNLSQREEMITIQRRAIENKVGLWASEPEGDEPYYVGDPKKLLFHCPNERIVKKIRNPVTFKNRIEAFLAGYGAFRGCKD